MLGKGQPMCLSTFLTVIGLAVLLLSDFVPTRRFAELTIVTLTGALIGALFLLPRLRRPPVEAAAAEPRPEPILRVRQRALVATACQVDSPAFWRVHNIQSTQDILNNHLRHITRLKAQ